MLLSSRLFKIRGRSVDLFVPFLALAPLKNKNRSKFLLLPRAFNMFACLSSALNLWFLFIFFLSKRGKPPGVVDKHAVSLKVTFFEIWKDKVIIFILR